MRYEDASQSGSFQDQGPIARDDADQLAAGDRGPATGNLISGAGTETGATGADSGTGARVTAVAGAGGQDNSFAAGQLRVEGEHGSLSVTARGDYVYRLKADVPENSRDTFTYTLSDSAGADSQARLTIEIGRTQAVVAANAQRIVPGPDGVVVLPAGVELSDIRVSGRDLLVMLPDGTQMVIVDGAVFVPQLVINDIEVPSTNLAALLIEQEPRPASGVPQSGGGNFATPVGPLDPGAPLGDLLAPTELRYAPPEFRQLGLDEDRRPEVGSNPLVQIDDDVRTGGNAGGIGDDADGVNRNGVLSGSGGDGSLAFALSLAGAPAGFTYVAGANGALLVQQGGVTVLTVTLDARSGAYSVTQNAPIQHAPGSNENNVTFTFGYTVTDRDGDNAAGNFQVDVDDDTPVIDVTAGADAGVTLTTDDADTGGAVSDAVSSSANFGAVFGLTQSAGGDGQSSAGLSFALSTSGGPSGLTQGGVGINLYLIGGKIVGSTATSAAGVTAANSVFDVSVSSTGVVTLTQYSHIDHGNADPSPTGAPFNDQLVTLADNLVTLTASGTISDRDGDSASDSVSVQIGANLRFTDDGPSLAGVSVGAGVVLDETDAGFPISATSASAVIDASALSFGADGAAATSATSYAISVVGGGTTPLRTAAGDFAISLVQTSASIITGTYVEGGVTKTAFTVTINANGTVTVQQFVALEHTIDGSTLAAFDDALDLAGLVNATITIRDFDGDTASATAGIGNLVSFRDDGPDSRLNVEAPRDVLVLDETQPVGSDTQGASAPTGVASVTANFADNFAAASFGADGAGSVSYALVLNGSNVASGLHALDASGAATRGAEILLNQQGNVVTGSADGVALFTIAVDPATGIVTFTQLGPVWNPAAGASFDEAAFLRLAEGSLLLRQTVTDSDGDSDATSIDIGQGQFQIQDDGPIARADTDEVVAGAYGPETGNVLTGAGTTSGAAGADMAGRDGASVVAVRSGERSDASFDAAGNLVVQGQHGVLILRADGSYSYVRNSGTPGGVDDVFTYTLRDGDGDTSDATLTIRIGNMAPTVNAPDAGAEGTLVHEAALGERGAGEAIGSGEEALAGADGDPREATQGIIRIGQGDGPATVTIAGVTITGTGQVIDTGEGLLTVTAIATGQLSYSYQLKDNQLANGGSVVDSFEVTVTDRDGDVARDTLAITIVDDAAVANDDRDMVAAGKFGPETGNVITGEGTIFSGKDVVGADGASLVSVSGRSGMDDVFDADGNLTVSGQYGVLTIKADGSYSYLRNAGTPGGVEDVFTYTLRDGDGDLDTATLTIGIGDEQPRIEAPNIGSDGTVVHEAALSGDRGVGESEGSGEAAAEGPNGDGRETVEGSILIGRGDGSATITIGGVTLTEVGQVIDTGEGLLTITAICLDAIGYSYTLKDNVSGEGDRIDEIALTITDADGDVARDTLTITIRDDAPIATSDTDSLGHADLRATGNVLTGVDPAGGDRNATDGTADLAGADGASLTAIASNNRPANAATTDAATGDLLVTGQYGTLRIAANGDYSYSRHDGSPVAATDVFTYTLTDGDGDKSTATLTIGLDDAGVAIAIPEAGSAATTVFEAALGTAPQGSSEAALPGVNDDAGESVSGTIAFTARDGLGSISLGGVTLGTTFPQTLVDDANQTLVVTDVSFDAATGTGSISYRYTLGDNRLGDQSVNNGDTAASFALVVTDSDGDRSQGNLVIAVRDDSPVARADSDSVTEGATTGGNVVLGTGTDSSVAGADVQGADGAVVVGVKAGGDTSSAAVGTPGSAIVGAYGTLTLNADGSYSYVARPDSVGSAQADVFTYSIRDADGDVSTTTLTITVNTIALVADNAVKQVDEAALDLLKDGLDLAAGTVTGSNPESSAETATGQLSVAGATGFELVGSGNGSHGILQLNPQTGAYTYTLTSPAAHGGMASNVSETFTYVARDGDGNSVTGTIRIDIADDVPSARDDNDVVIEGLGNVADGNVLTGTGGSDGNGSDGVADEAGADGGATVVGARTSVEDGAGSFQSVPAGSSGMVIAGTYGDLLIRADGSYSYTLKVAAIPVGVTGESFTYQMRDGDGDIDVAELNIAFVQDTNIPTVVGATGTVFEDGLADGNQHGPASETVTGNFQVGIGQEGAVITVNGVNPSVGASIDTGEGILTIIGTTVANGVITYDYSYTLKAPLGHAGAGEANPILDTILIEVADATGDKASGTLTIRIVDDVPTAAFDSDSLAGGSFGPETGNVLTGAGTTSGAAGLDTPGADGAAVVGIKAGSDTAAFTGNMGAVVQGLYGKLVLQADGNYSYVRDAGTPGGVTDTFSYTLRDGDGDTAVAELAIVIGNALVTVSVPPAGSAATTVFERGLPERGSEPAGSGELDDGNGTNNSDPSELTSGTLSFVAKDGLASVTLGGVALNLGATGTQTIVDTAGEKLVVTGISYDAATGAGSIRYEYAAKDNSLAEAGSASFALVVTDRDGDVGQGNLVIAIVDDAPTARNDLAEQASENAPVTFGVFGNDTFGADGVDTDNSPAARVSFTQPAQGSVTYDPATGLFTFVAAPGQTGEASFTYTIEDGDGDRSTATVTVKLVGDSTPQVSDASARIDDDGLSGGLAGGVGDIDANVGDLGSSNEAVFAGRIAVNFGNDTAGSAISFANLHNTAGTVGTEAVTYSWNASTNVLTATSARGAVFTVTVNPATGDYRVDLLQNVLHQPGGAEASTDVALAYRATDGDGDTVETGRLVIAFNDDTPTFTSIQAGTANNMPSAALTTGALSFSIGADSPATVAAISFDTAGIRSGGFALVTNLSGNVLTAYQDVNADGVYTAGTDTNAVFTLTVDPASGSYAFDLIRPLDGTIDNTPVGGSLSFGSGPTQSQVLERTDGVDVAVVTGYNAGPAFNENVWMTTGVASGLALSSVNGSTAGWGVSNNNLEGAEFFNWDFGSGPLDTQGGLFTPPTGVALPQVSFAVFDFINYNGATDIKYVVRYTDGSFESGTVPSIHYDGSSNADATNWTVAAPAGKYIADVELFASGAAPGKVDLVSLGVLNTAVNHNLGFTVTLADEDGDTASRSFSINVADSNTPSSATASTGTARTMQTSSLLVDDMGSDSDVRTSSANTNLALMAGLAAGFAAMPAAATPMDGLAFQAGSQALGDSRMSWMLQAFDTGQDGRADVLRSELEHGPVLEAGIGSEPVQHFTDGAAPESIAVMEDTSEVEPFRSDGGTEPDGGRAGAGQLFAGGEIHLPTPEQLEVMIGAAERTGPVQVNPVLESILADALAGGEAGLDIDQVIEAAIRLADPIQHVPVESAPIAVHADVPSDTATPLLAAVSGWDGSHFSPLFPAAATAMENMALHADAIQPIANG